MDLTKVYKCCRPFPKSNKKCSSSKRFLTEEMIQKLVAMQCEVPLNTSLKICGSCRVSVYRFNPQINNREDQPATSNVNQPLPSQDGLEEIPSASSIVSASSKNSDVPDYSRIHNIELFNMGIPGISVSQVSLKKLEQISYPQQKFKEITNGMRRSIFNFPEEEDEAAVREQKFKDYDEMINQLKEKFSDAETTRPEKFRILTVLPKSWSVQKMVTEFGINKTWRWKPKNWLNKKEYCLHQIANVDKV